jgi:hypothetical protein
MKKFDDNDIDGLLSQNVEKESVKRSMLWKERENETEGRDRLKTQSSVGVKMI